MSDATGELIAERGKTHGSYDVHAEITQRLKAEMRESANWPLLDHCQKESLEMFAHKIGRILAGDPNFKDHWDDIAGYSRLVADRLAPFPAPPAGGRDHASPAKCERTVERGA